MGADAGPPAAAFVWRRPQRTWLDFAVAAVQSERVAVRFGGGRVFKPAVNLELL